MSRKELMEIRAVKLIAQILGAGYRGVHTGSDTSKSDGEIRYLEKLFAVLEVTIDDDEESEESDSIWLNDMDKPYFQGYLQSSWDHQH